MLVYPGFQEPTTFGRKNTEKNKWILRNMGLQHVLHLGTIFPNYASSSHLAWCNPSIGRSMSSGLCESSSCTVEWSFLPYSFGLNLLRQGRHGPLLSQMGPCPTFLNLSLRVTMFSRWMMKLFVFGSCLWSCL